MKATANKPRPSIHKSIVKPQTSLRDQVRGKKPTKGESSVRKAQKKPQHQEKGKSKKKTLNLTGKAKK